MFTGTKYRTDKNRKIQKKNLSKKEKTTQKKQKLHFTLRTFAAWTRAHRPKRATCGPEQATPEGRTTTPTNTGTPCVTMAKPAVLLSEPSVPMEPMDLKKMKKQLQLRSSLHYQSTKDLVSNIFKNYAKHNEVSSTGPAPAFVCTHAGDRAQCGLASQTELVQQPGEDTPPVSASTVCQQGEPVG